MDYRSLWGLRAGDGDEGSDADAIEAVAYSSLPDPRTPGEVLVDLDTIESITGETVEGALAVALSGPGGRGNCCRDDVDPTDAEALWEEEQRDLEWAENVQFGHRHRVPDLFELTRCHRGVAEEQV